MIRRRTAVKINRIFRIFGRFIIVDSAVKNTINALTCRHKPFS
jgi:hypothetical protein